MDILSFVRAKHNLIFKLIVVTGCSLLLTWMVPAGEIRGHRVDRLTTIWPYEDIVPRQDFLIRKTDGEIAEEKKSLIGTSPLFFEHSDRDKGDASPALTEIRKNDENLFFKLAFATH